VVCHVYEGEHGYDCEAVYIDDLKRAINEDLIWDGSQWQFALAGPNGGYADNFTRVADFVAILRRGEHPPYDSQPLHGRRRRRL
jgi:hypothetical protein